MSVDARLDATTSTAVFRILLDALARPGTVVGPAHGAPASIPPILLPALALADLDVTVCVLGWDSSDVDVATARVDHDPDGSIQHGTDLRVAQLLASVTGARIVDRLEDADLVVAIRPPTVGEIDRLRVGDAGSPERGTRLVLAAAEFGRGRWWEVAGPGATPPRRFALDGVDGTTLDRLSARNDGFPAGIDTWIVVPDGRFVGLPRSVRVRAVADRVGHEG